MSERFTHPVAEFIAPYRGSWEPQRTNNFVLHINIGRLNLPSAREYGSQVLEMAMQSTFVPKVSVEVEEIKWMNISRKVAGVPTFEDGTATFIDYIDRPIQSILWEWMLKVADHTNGRVGLARDYKTYATLVLLPPNAPSNGASYNPNDSGRGTTAMSGDLHSESEATPAANADLFKSIRKWRFDGLFPKDLSGAGSLDYGTVEANKVEVTFAYDVCTPILQPEGHNTPLSTIAEDIYSYLHKG